MKVSSRRDKEWRLLGLARVLFFMGLVFMGFFIFYYFAPWVLCFWTQTQKPHHRFTVNASQQALSFHCKLPPSLCQNLVPPVLKSWSLLRFGCTQISSFFLWLDWVLFLILKVLLALTFLCGLELVILSVGFVDVGLGCECLSFHLRVWVGNTDWTKPHRWRPENRPPVVMKTFSYKVLDFSVLGLLIFCIIVQNLFLFFLIEMILLNLFLLLLLLL